MTNIKFIFPILSFIILAAHSLRVSDISFFILNLMMIPSLFIKYAWVRIILISALVWGVYIWINTSYFLIHMRLTYEMHWIRLAIIMGVTLLFMLFSIYLLLIDKFKKRYNLSEKSTAPLTTIFLCIFIFLEIASNFAPMQLLLADRFFPAFTGIEIFILSLYGVWIGNKMLDPAKTQIVRSRVWLIFSGLFFIQLILGLGGVEKMLMTGKLHLPIPAMIIAAPLYRGSGFFMPILFLITLFLVGPAWCSYLCYIGAWDDKLSKSSKSKIKPLPEWCKKTRNIILIITIVLPIILNLLNINLYISSVIAIIFGIIGLIVMVFISRKLGVMAHCTVFCPVGLVGNFLGKISPWRMKISPKCNSCMKCTKTCRYNALNKNDIMLNRPGLSCTLCGDCIEKCDDRFITYNLFNLSPQNSRTIFIVMVIIIHVIFLAVARM